MVLKIERPQQSAFEADTADRFPNRLRSLLLSRLPEQRELLAQPEGLDLVKKRIMAARTQGFTGELDVARYVTLGFIFGETFPGEPWARTVLADPKVQPPTRKIEILWRIAEDRALDDTARSTARTMSGGKSEE